MLVVVGGVKWFAAGRAVESQRSHLQETQVPLGCCKVLRGHEVDLLSPPDKSCPIHLNTFFLAEGRTCIRVRQKLVVWKVAVVHKGQTETGKALRCNGERHFTAANYGPCIAFVLGSAAEW